MTDYINEANLHDFSLENGMITSTSQDPWITLTFSDKQFVKTIEIEITEISEIDVTATILTGGGQIWKSKSLNLQTGINLVCFPWLWDDLSFLRLDLAEKPNVSLKIGYIIINNPLQIAKSALVESFFLGLLLVFVFNIVILKKNGPLNNINSSVITEYQNHISSVYRNELFRKILILTGKCWFIFSISIYAIIRTNFRYIDDIGRTYSGSVSDWNVYSRYFAEILCKFLSAGNLVVDTSPLPQIITMLFMAISVSIIISIITPRNLTSNWLVVAAIPFAISPYFMENISYKIECVIHGASVLVSVLPLLFYKKKSWIYGAITANCIALMCITYQAASGIFPIVVIMIAAVQWNKGESVKQISKFLISSSIGYLVGLCIFKFLIMNPVSTHVSSETLSLSEILPGFFHNLLTFYGVINYDFKISWKIIIIIILIIYIIIYSFSSKSSPIISIIAGIISLILLFCFCFGIYPALKDCVYYPRAMYGICVILSMISIYIISQGLFVSKVAVLSLSWCFILFAFEYGNCLDLQQEYTDVRLQTVIDYLNEHYDADTQYTLELNGFINQAPAIRNQTENNPLLSKLIPQSFGGGWVWSEYKLYCYYGLPSNYNVVWVYDRANSDIDLLQKDLPLSDCLMWFDVYSDGNQILIQMKN